MNGTLTIEPTAALSQHFDAREDFARWYEHRIEYAWVSLLIVLIYRCVIEQGAHVVLYFVDSFLDYISSWSDECIDLAMRALSDFKEDYRTFANNLIDNESGHDDEEDGAESQDEMELAPEDILISMLNKVVEDLLKVSRLHLLILHEFGLWHAVNTYAIFYQN